MQRMPIFWAGSLFSVLWASAFVAGKVALVHIDPMSLLCARFAVAGCLMLAWALRTRPAAAWRSQALLANAVVLGVFNNALYLGLSFLGLRTVSPEATVLIVSTAPFFAIALSVISGSRCTWPQLAGVVTGFGGVYLVLSARMQGGAEPYGMLLVLLGTLSFAASTVWYRRRAAQHDPLLLNGLQNLVGALAMLPFAPHLPQAFSALQHPDYLLAFAHLVLLVSIADFLLWLALLRRIGVAQASSFHLLNPVFGIVLSALVFGTALRGSDVWGTLVVVAGLALATWPKKTIEAVR
ncbi:DMT family transporter [Comamonas sp. GB3 AK4-5]|uniref:DMT family transporter n=1 Tax=Comamonas sp. GB3 AK4-5 TaxID=3231487 RepID=UPI00351EF899